MGLKSRLTQAIDGRNPFQERRTAKLVKDELPRILANIQKLANRSDWAAACFLEVLCDKFHEITENDEWQPEVGFTDPREDVKEDE